MRATEQQLASVATGSTFSAVSSQQLKEHQIVLAPSNEQVPKGLGAKHDAEGILEILPPFEAGLTDIEGFSHLIVLWVFDRAEGFELLGTPPTDNRPHGVFATRSPRRPNPIGFTVVELLRREGVSLH